MGLASFPAFGSIGIVAKPVLERAHPVVAWQDVSVRYPYDRRKAVGPATLGVSPGERLLLLGPSGSGKSTLLHTLTGLVPQSIPAEVTGSVMLFGHEVGERTPAQWAAEVAQLFQNPEETLCGMTVEDEVVFALENQGLPVAEIRQRFRLALERVGLPWDWRARRTMTLSGGEKQMVALAAVIAQQAPLLVIDEPTAHLAPAAASRLRTLLMEQEMRSVIVVDHRLDGLLGMIDRIALIDACGRVVDGGDPRGFFRSYREKLAALGVWLPPAAELDAALSDAGIVLDVPPLTMEEAAAGLAALPVERLAGALKVVRAFVARHMAGPPASAPETEIVAELRNADCAPLFGPVVLDNISLALRRGETVAILGRNGSGKSTLGASLAGLLRLKRGRRSGAAGGLSFQNPENQFLAGSVRDEVLAALRHSGQDDGKRLAEVLAAWGLTELSERHPFELSQGQKRSLALATLAESGRWPLLVLDEPTAGLDAAGKSVLEDQIERLARRGHAIAIITHDLDFALKTCMRAIIVDQGGIVADAPAARLLRDRALLKRSDLDEPALIALLRWLEREHPC